MDAWGYVRGVGERKEREEGRKKYNL